MVTLMVTMVAMVTLMVTRIGEGDYVCEGDDDSEGDGDDDITRNIH